MHIFIDANTALHYRRPDEVDWCSLVGRSQIVLVGAPILTRELEHQKIHNPSRKLRQRAEAYIKWLVQFVRDPTLEVRAGVRWHFIPEEPSIDFPAHKLSLTIADDQLIAAAITYAASPGTEIQIATADIGLEIKLRSRQLLPLLLPDSIRLLSEPDPLEKEVQTLRRQIAERRLPTLALKSALGNDRHPMKIKPHVIQPSSKTLPQIQREHPPLVVPTGQPEAGGNPSVRALQRLGGVAVGDAFRRIFLSPERVASYNREREAYLVEYGNYFHKLLDWERQSALTVELQLTLSNEGKAPATDIDIILHFPDDMLLIDSQKVPKRPQPPRPPERPDETENLFGPSRISVPDMFHPLRPQHGKLLIPDAHRSATVDLARFEAKYWCRNLKHGFTEKLDPTHFRFRDRVSVRQFQVEYEISAAELSERTTGKLHFVMDE